MATPFSALGMTLVAAHKWKSASRRARLAKTKVTKKDKKAVKAGINGVDNKLQEFQGAAIREACHCLEKQPISRYKRRRTAQLIKVLESDFEECRDRLFHVIAEFLKTNEGNLYTEACLSSYKGATDNSIQIVKRYLEKTLIDTKPTKGKESAQERGMKGDQIGYPQQSTQARLGDGTESDASHVDVGAPNNRALSLPGASSPAPTSNPTLAPSYDRVPLTKDPETHHTVLSMQPIQEKSSPDTMSATSTLSRPSVAPSLASNRSHTESEVFNETSKSFPLNPIKKMATWSAGDQPNEPESSVYWARLKVVGSLILLLFELLVRAV